MPVPDGREPPGVIAARVHGDRSGDVRTATADGWILLRDRERPALDMRTVVREMKERVTALIDRAHDRRVQEDGVRDGRRRGQGGRQGAGHESGRRRGPGRFRPVAVPHR